MKPNRVADLSVLLEETPLTYYWLGFLIADGHFYKRGAIKLHLAKEDTDQVIKYKKFIKYTGKSKLNVANIMQPDVVMPLMSKFNISNKKTYEPCNLDGISDDLFFSLIIGIIDGDGSMRIRHNKAYAIEIKMHANWFYLLRKIDLFLHKLLLNKSNKRCFARINKKGYALLILSNFNLLEKIKTKLTELNLPILNRKWDTVTKGNDSIKKDIKETRIIQIKKMFNEGVTRRDMCKTLKLHKSTLNNFIRKENL